VQGWLVVAVIGCYFSAALANGTRFTEMIIPLIMGERRKPTVTMLLNIHGKKSKVELFPKGLFEYESLCGAKRFRLRINGKWFPKKKKEYYTKWEFRDLLFRSIRL